MGLEFITIVPPARHMPADRGRVLTTYTECTELARAALPLLETGLNFVTEPGWQI